MASQGQNQRLRILGDYTFSEHLKDVKVSELLGVPYTFVEASTMTTIALEMDARGSETILILGCMSSVFDGIMLHGADNSNASSVIDRLRLIFDSYFARPHEVYALAPLCWPPSRADKRYQEMYSEFGQFLLGYSARQPQFKVVKGVKTQDRWFRTGGLRMKHEYGVQYVTHQFQTLRQCFNRSGVLSLSDSLEKDMKSMLEEEADEDVFAETIGGVRDQPENRELVRQAQEIRRLSDELAAFKAKYEKRRMTDTYRFAEMAEADDYKLNLANSNRVMITGLKSSEYPTESSEQQTFVMKVVGDFVSRVLGRESEFAVKVWSVEHRRMAKGSTEVLIPAIEVTFTLPPDDAIEFRKGASTRAKSREKGFEGVYFSHYIGLQTRIRIEILKSLSEVIKTQNSTMDAYCVANGVRPLLSYGAKGTRIGRKTFLFVAALKNWESLLSQLDLTESYKKAKNIFIGKMEHLFVVLKEPEDQTQVTGVNQLPVGSKRPADGSLSNAAKKSGK